MTLRSTGNVMSIITFTLLAIALAMTDASADAANGQRLARQWCIACHIISPDQKQASADVRPFSAIAADPNFSRNKLALFLLDPHPKMPNLTLSRSEATDLADYIASLAKPK